MTGAADDDPSGIATYSQAGAQFGYGLLWTMILTYPLMAAVQLVSAHIGRVTGAGLGKNLGRVFPHPVVSLLVTILLIANIFNIGADLSAMAAAAQLVGGGSSHIYVILFALLAVGLQLFIPYRQYSSVLKWLTLSLLAYVGVILLVHIDWPQALLGMIWPRNLGMTALLTVVAVLGTTISPYLFFWQTAEEVEEMEIKDQPNLKEMNPQAARLQLRRMGIDTFAGMSISNLIAFFIMLTTAVTLHQSGVTDIQTSAQAAEALRPVAGNFAFLLFSLGIIGTGFLAVPVLAGSTAYAACEACNWPKGLEKKPGEAKAFYGVIVAGMLIALGVLFSPLDPIKMLFWSAVINGIIAVPIMAAMMIVARQHRRMGVFVATPWQRILGWAATLAMGAAVIGMFVV